MTIAEFVMKRDGEHDPYYEVAVTEWNVDIGARQDFLFVWTRHSNKLNDQM